MTRTEISAPVRAALARLIDYAGLYPPATLAMEAAIGEYDAASKGPFEWMLGRFIVPASRIDDVSAAGDSFALSVIVDAGGEQMEWFSAAQGLLANLSARRINGPRMRMEALEIPLPPLRTQRDTFDAAIGQCAALLSNTQLRDLPTYLELPRDDRWRDALPDAMTVLARHKLGAKIRCGGVVPNAFPSPVELAAFICAASEAGVAFKATAGLHHPVRHVDPATGFVMHGFLNMLAATLIARGGRADGVEAALTEEDASAFRIDDSGFSWRDCSFDVSAIQAMRSHGFVAYGSCSFAEPIEDLAAMRVLERVS
jgi:hypothetical protein